MKKVFLYIFTFVCGAFGGYLVNISEVNDLLEEKQAVLLSVVNYEKTSENIIDMQYNHDDNYFLDCIMETDAYSDYVEAHYKIQEFIRNGRIR